MRRFFGFLTAFALALIVSPAAFATTGPPGTVEFTSISDNAIAWASTERPTYRINNAKADFIIPASDKGWSTAKSDPTDRPIGFTSDPVLDQADTAKIHTPTIVDKGVYAPQPAITETSKKIIDDIAIAATDPGPPWAFAHKSSTGPCKDVIPKRDACIPGINGHHVDSPCTT